MTGKLSLAEVNAMARQDFIARFGGIAEHSPWVAEAAAGMRPFHDMAAVVSAFETAVRAAPRARRLELLRAHPDLAGRAKEITQASRREQQGAGLDTLTAEEFARFTSLNRRYRSAFGFPFIFAVRGATKHQILESFERRIENSPDAEFKTALDNVCAILRFRLEDRVQS
ncbi:MAG TPA: 2-oxo-4-hydroxy-4-carboxy-5-ureidoimidazoline decarboxylase [Aestuariivirgaceae bacterium]|jgi:2-oxo-4-hydroxy-4-carboxy-5-ureidoimidazoline decarboxylase